MVQLLSLDVEGVLALPGGGQFPWPLEQFVELRRALKDSPLATILCTGRQAPYGEAIIQCLDLFSPLPDDIRARVVARGGPSLVSWPSITENGAHFYDPLAKQPFPHPALTPERVRRLQRLKSEILLPLAAETGAVVGAGKDFSVSLNPPPVAPGSSERQPIDQFRAQVDQALAGYEDAVEVKHSKSAVDITPRGISKASAVRQLLDWTGLQPEEALGVGDTKADAEWLQVVGWRAAPANGRDALPGMHYYAPREVAEGLLDIVSRLRDQDYRGL